MTQFSDATYYRRRANQALDLASRAASTSIRSIHLELAQRYAELATTVAMPLEPIAHIS